MLKFLKFGDDTGTSLSLSLSLSLARGTDDPIAADSLNAKDALLLWVQNKTAGYPNLKIENFKKSFKDGLALCAIIHKHRPTLIDYESLSPVRLLGSTLLSLLPPLAFVYVCVLTASIACSVGGHRQHQDRHGCG